MVVVIVIITNTTTVDTMTMDVITIIIIVVDRVEIEVMIVQVVVTAVEVEVYLNLPIQVVVVKVVILQQTTMLMIVLDLTLLNPTLVHDLHHQRSRMETRRRRRSSRRRRTKKKWKARQITRMIPTQRKKKSHYLPKHLRFAITIVNLNPHAQQNGTVVEVQVKKVVVVDEVEKDDELKTVPILTILRLLRIDHCRNRRIARIIPLRHPHRHIQVNLHAMMMITKVISVVVNEEEEEKVETEKKDDENAAVAGINIEDHPPDATKRIQLFRRINVLSSFLNW